MDGPFSYNTLINTQIGSNHEAFSKYVSKAMAVPGFLSRVSQFLVIAPNTVFFTVPF